MTNKKAIIFDADGVLWNGETTSHIAGYKVLSKINKNMFITEKEFSDLLIGIRVKNQQETLQKFFKDNNYSIIFPENYIEELDKEQTKIFEAGFPPIEGIPEVLDYLVSNSIEFFIGSRCRISSLNKKLYASGLKKYFPDEHIYHPEKISDKEWGMLEKYRKDNLSISTEELQIDKTALFLYSSLINEFSPENCLVLEDTLSGLNSANRAHINTIGIATTTVGKENLQNVKKYPICYTSKEILKEIKHFLIS